jgi:hypothetical protein
MNMVLFHVSGPSELTFVLTLNWKYSNNMSEVIDRELKKGCTRELVL